ncbi:regulator of cell cycle RGCC-like [Colossoma macropomum]|uniref:regulator of cell cycle RGCC-like n=1 Tax=Colossoma macropomum TaxID=42526 RepID=UPI001863BF02|nr:regulator of cell cycle RGCC-like [Colossoma macropomum]
MSSTNFPDLEMDFGELLQEFNAVAEELSAPSLPAPHAYEHLLSEAKRRSNDGVNDSGIEDADEGSEPSQGSSLNASVEELSTAGTLAATKAKLGDTTDLQSFIENLDKELAEM